MRGIALVAAAALMMPALAASPENCTVESDMSLSGTIADIQSMREEPQAEIETYFKIALTAPVCGKQSVTASAIGLIPCRTGDAVTVTGRFSPPSKMFDTARIHGERETIRCTAPDGN